MAIFTSLANKIKERQLPRLYRLATGFSSIDSQLASIEICEYTDPETGEKSNRMMFDMGINRGTYFGLVGTSSSGKSTYLTELLVNTALIKGNEDGIGIYYSIEKESETDKRVMKCLGKHNIRQIPTFGDEGKHERLVIEKSISSVDDVFNSVKDVVNATQQSLSPDDFKKPKYKVYVRSSKRNEPFEFKAILPTSMVVVDSVSSMTTSQAQDDLNNSNEMDIGNTIHMQKGNKLSSWFTILQDGVYKSNMVAIFIQHLQKRISVSRFDSHTKALPGIAFDEVIKGPNAMIYVMENIMKLQAVSSKAAVESMNKLGIAFQVDVGFIKNRTGSVKVFLPLAFMPDGLFSRLYSNLLFLDARGYAKIERGMIKFYHHKAKFEDMFTSEFEDQDFLTIDTRNNDKITKVFKASEDSFNIRFSELDELYKNNEDIRTFIDEYIFDTLNIDVIKKTMRID